MIRWIIWDSCHNLVRSKKSKILLKLKMIIRYCSTNWQFSFNKFDICPISTCESTFFCSNSVTSAFFILCKYKFWHWQTVSRYTFWLHHNYKNTAHLVSTICVFPDSCLFLEFGNLPDYDWCLVVLHHCLTGFLQEALLCLAHVFGFCFAFVL